MYGGIALLAHSLLTETTQRSIQVHPYMITQRSEQTDATLLDVTCCVRLNTLLHVVGSCCAKFDTGQNFSYVPNERHNSLHCWLLGPFARSIKSTKSQKKVLSLMNSHLSFYGKSKLKMHASLRLEMD